MRSTDEGAVKAITVEAFSGVSIDQAIEHQLGAIRPQSWQAIKGAAVGTEVQQHTGTCFVAELEGQVIGYVTTAVSRETSTGRIPNIGVARGYRGLGLGTRLIEHALAFFREQGLRLARIETLAQNDVGDHLYRKLGFREVARQIHYSMPLVGTHTRSADGSHQDQEQTNEVTL